MLKTLALVPFTLAAMMSVGSAQAPGSYQDSCDNIRQRGPFLTAECGTRDGDSRVSSIDVRGCRGGITNNDGRLMCNRRSSRGYGYGYDDGSRYRHGDYDGSGGYPRGYGDDQDDAD